MTLTSIAPAELPEQTRTRKTKFDNEIVAQAISMLREGNAVQPDETFKNQGAARRFALSLKHRIDETEPNVKAGEKVSTRVWEDGKVWRCAILLREAKSS